jgi:hypothetical protein
VVASAAAMFSRWRLETKKSNILSVPAVLKVSKREFAEKAITNYQRYVKWGVPYLWRVDVLGTGFNKHFGAIAYSFVMSGNFRNLRRSLNIFATAMRRL